MKAASVTTTAFSQGFPFGRQLYSFGALAH